jgi:hypothetical protein
LRRRSVLVPEGSMESKRGLKKALRFIKVRFDLIRSINKDEENVSITDYSLLLL